MATFSGFEHIVREQQPLAPYTWLRIGGNAEYFAEPTSNDELVALVRRCHEQQVPVRVLGGGSNVLVRSPRVEGLVLHLSAPAFTQIVTAGNRITAGGGARLGHVISTAVRDGLAGLEPLAGIPGTVGGALLTNVDANGSSIGQWTTQVTLLTRRGELVERQREQLRFAHRQSNLDELAIVSAQFTLEQQTPATLTKRMQKFWIVKQQGQPDASENPCCVFRDVGGIGAATLIDQAGLKGSRVGNASLSDRDASFVIAAAGTTGDQVLELIELVKAGVREQLGVDLQEQLSIW